MPIETVWIYSLAMGFLYQHDGQRVRSEFTCPCGSKEAERVKDNRPDGSIPRSLLRCYIRCAMCHRRSSTTPIISGSEGVEEPEASLNS